ncbi:MAG: sarcosine oxidase subunit alpha, partial [Proteobacteria bacterium]|nr:sarcosine oxidase subunit alpha [Pseudomonadota bacterium]
RISDRLAEPDPRLPRERLWQVRAKEIVLATGAIERPLVFPGNDRPAVMLAGAARTYLGRYGVLAGTRAVVLAGAGEAYGVAMDLARHGISIEAVVDLGSGELTTSRARVEAEASGLPVIDAEAVLGTRGRHRIASLEVGQSGGAKRRFDCDLVLMAGGYAPTLHLFPQFGGRLAWDEARQAFLPEAPIEHVHVAGAAGGQGWSVGAALESGFAAGAAAARAFGLNVAEPVHPKVGERVIGYYAGRVAATSMPHGGRAFVDFQNDVTAKDLELAAREGFRSIEHIKRYTTTGMATDQGKTSNVNAIGIVAAVEGRGTGQAGHTTFRPPFTPVTFGTLAGAARGALFDPVRLTPIDASARARGAVFENVGQWQRAHYFPEPREGKIKAVARECLAVRNAVGVLDASTLGKIEVVGPGAATFLDRMYVAPIASLKPGRSRYSLMLSEAGFVMDDGIVARLSADRFHVTTTTGGAARVLAHMEDYLQTEFTDCECWLTSITEQWGVIALQGPKARDVLESLVEGVDISANALPHMGLAEGRIRGVPMRLFRVSFTGELGFEVNVPSGRAQAVWDAILERAAALGGVPYGTEAMHVLRAEKGYIIVGQESDGTVTPSDLGFGIGARKADFVGKRSLARADLVKADRPGLVGLECIDGGGVLEEGAQITQRPDPPAGTPASGYVTSAYASATLGRPIALALVNGGARRMGETLFVPGARRARQVRVVSPVLYDPEGARLHG